jgi:hypothetical protein
MALNFRTTWILDRVSQLHSRHEYFGRIVFVSAGARPHSGLSQNRPSVFALLPRDREEAKLQWKHRCLRWLIVSSFSCLSCFKQYNTVYCSIIFANRIKSRPFVTLSEGKPDVKTSSRRLKPDSCQKQRYLHKTDCLTADSVRPHRRRHLSFVCISCYQSGHCQNLISVVSASDERRICTVKRDGQWLLY